MLGCVYPVPRYSGEFENIGNIDNKKEGIHMSEAIILQEAILKECRRDHVPVTLFLMNGFQLRGIITGFDSFVVVLVSDGKQQMIYKHAISTLAPMKPLKAAATTA